jgi:chromosome partitioning protein
MLVITTAVIKGGTGKTTTTAALAQAAKAAGKRVLVIDLDPQGNCSRFIAAKSRKPGSYELLTGQASAKQAVQSTPQGLDAIAARDELSALAMTADSGSAFTLRDALKAIANDYDLAFIDTPPQIGALTLNALAAADVLLIPLETDAGSVHGLHYIGELVEAVNKANPRLAAIGTIVTRYDGRPRINQTMRDIIAERSGEYGARFLGCIRNGIAVREAQAMQQSLFEYNKNANPAKDYAALFANIIETTEKTK